MHLSQHQRCVLRTDTQSFCRTLTYADAASKNPAFRAQTLPFRVRTLEPSLEFPIQVLGSGAGTGPCAGRHFHAGARRRRGQNPSQTRVLSRSRAFAGAENTRSSQELCAKMQFSHAFLCIFNVFFFRRVFKIQSFGIFFSAKSCSRHSACAFSTVSILGFARALFAPNAICKGSPRRL